MMAIRSTQDIPSEAPALVHNPASHALSIQSLPVPELSGSEEHLIRVHAVALTNGELAWPEPATLSDPIPGYEFAGTVISSPPASHFQPGSRVYARTAFNRPGSARRYSIALTNELGSMPTNLSWEEAATVPLSALTAWQALFVHGGIAPPDGIDDSQKRNGNRRLLVTAAAGGVGLWVLQLARLAGVGHITGVASQSNAEFLADLGAHEVIDYKAAPNTATWLKENGKAKFDLVIDGVGGDSLEQSWLCVKENGLLISIAMPTELRKPSHDVEDGVKSLFFIVEADGEQLNRITSLIDQGKAKAVLDSAFPIQDYEAAFKKVLGGHVRGKVVLTISD
jgi:NADPH:quinone reductase-like Zn-dependent oxidoreductase